MAGQAMGNIPSQMPQQTNNMLTNRFTGFNPGQFQQMPQMAQMPPSPLSMPGSMPNMMPNQMAFQNANFAAGLDSRFPMTMPQMGMQGGMPNQMAFQNANPMAQLDTRFANGMPGGMPNQMAFDNANPAANLMGRFNPPEMSTMPVRTPGARPF